MDAKYKKHPCEYEKPQDRRDDLYQIISYMFRLKAEFGILVYPSQNTLGDRIHKLHKDSYGGNIQQINMQISTKNISFKEFKEEMTHNESKFHDKIEALINNSNMA